MNPFIEEQNEDFFKKWGFTQSQTIPNPYNDDAPPMKFSGFESKYVSELEYENRQLKEVCAQYERTIASQARLQDTLRDGFMAEMKKKGTSES